MKLGHCRLPFSTSQVRHGCLESSQPTKAEHIAPREYPENGEEPVSDSQQRQSRRGYLNPSLVRSVSFWITSLCILVAVFASLLAIWQFAGTDILWRTVATCAVIGSGTVAFYWVNVLFGATSE
jgi:hypothetical protein